MLLAVLLATAHMEYKQHYQHWEQYDDSGYEATTGH